MSDMLSGLRSASFGSSGDEATVLDLEQAVPSPLSASLDLSRVVQLYAYQPRDVDEILEFDRRITRRYSEFLAEAGEYYGGTFRCAAFGAQWIVEIATFAADDAPSAEALVADLPIPADVAQIIDECKALQDRDKARYLIWLLPVGSQQ